jgi:hypothetical protein
MEARRDTNAGQSGQGVAPFATIWSPMGEGYSVGITQADEEFGNPA